jgi:hypothetical protein
MMTVAVSGTQPLAATGQASTARAGSALAHR